MSRRWIAFLVCCLPGPIFFIPLAIAALQRSLSMSMIAGIAALSMLACPLGMAWMWRIKAQGCCGRLDESPHEAKSLIR